MTARRPHLLKLMLFMGIPIALYLVWTLDRAGGFHFEHPWALGSLGLVAITYGFVQWRSAQQRAHMNYSGAALAFSVPSSPWARFAALPDACHWLALLLLSIALAGPQTQLRAGSVEFSGIDIVVALDLSKSMEAQDMAPNRLQAAKAVLDRFISRRRTDRISLVLFGRDAFTHIPLTLDYSAYRTLLGDVRLGLIDGSATAIGNALTLSLARLRKSDAKSRVIILMTDGESNAGNVSPEEATRYAVERKVKTFTILMGGGVRRVRDVFGRIREVKAQFPVNPAALKAIADATGGQAYRATDRDALAKNFEDILSKLEKTERSDIAAVYRNAFQIFAGLALALICLGLALRMTRFRVFP